MSDLTPERRAELRRRMACGEAGSRFSVLLAPEILAILEADHG